MLWTPAWYMTHLWNMFVRNVVEMFFFHQEKVFYQKEFCLRPILIVDNWKLWLLEIKSFNFLGLLHKTPKSFQVFPNNRDCNEKDSNAVNWFGYGYTCVCVYMCTHTEDAVATIIQSWLRFLPETCFQNIKLGSYYTNKNNQTTLVNVTGHDS